MIYDSQSNKRPRENCDSEQDPNPKHPRKLETGRNSVEAEPITPDDPAINRYLLVYEEYWY